MWWPLGGCIEVISDQCGLDAMGVFMPTMKKLSGQSRWQVFIDPPYTPYAPLLTSEGIDLQEIMLVHPRSRDEILWSADLPLYEDMAPWNIVMQGPRMDYIDYDTRDRTFDAYVQRAYQTLSVLMNYKRTVQVCPALFSSAGRA